MNNVVGYMKVGMVTDHTHIYRFYMNNFYALRITRMLWCRNLTCRKPHCGNYTQKEVIIKLYNYFVLPFSIDGSTAVIQEG